MSKYLLSAFIFLFGLSAAGYAEEVDNSRYDTIAERFVDALSKGDRAGLEALIDPLVSGRLRVADLIAAYDKVIAENGEVRESGGPRKENFSHYKLVFLPRKFARNYLDLQVVVSRKSDKVSGFFILPHKKGYSAPSYVVADAYKEVPVQFGLPQWKLWGRLSIPVGIEKAGKKESSARYPAIVLVHGSGSMDMDESVGSNKPFLDLARGLASSGIAVLRYTKRTKQYKLNESQILRMTVKEEVLDDVAQAVACLSKATGVKHHIDPDKIFVLGHSMGGMLIPRIAKACPSVRGFVSLAGSNIPLPRKLVDQYEYLAQAGDRSARAQLPRIKREMAKVLSLTEGDKNAIYMGASSRYWADLNRYKPLQEIVSIDKPVLFLQGGRDYQVTASGDFANWREAVRNKSGHSTQYQFEIYPELNHLFIPGQGKSTPQEYFRDSGNVDPRVVQDIARFIKSNSI